jgi:hypothetical protein
MGLFFRGPCKSGWHSIGKGAVPGERLALDIPARARYFRVRLPSWLYVQVTVYKQVEIPFEFRCGTKIEFAGHTTLTQTCELRRTCPSAIHT